MKFTKDRNPNDDDLDEIHRTVLNIVQSNIAKFVQVNKYGAINADKPNNDDFYVVQFTSMPCTLQEDQIDDNGIIKSGTIVSKKNKLSCARADSTWFLAPKEGPLQTIVKLQHVLVADLDVKVVRSSRMEYKIEDSYDMTEMNDYL
eukprot:11743287-Ditylum_brightwellii.AAC.1